MAIDARAVLAALVVLASCRTAAPVIDPGLASTIPPDTVLVAGANLEQLRSSALYAKLPRAVLAALEPLRGASYIVLAANGKDFMVVARGGFGEAPPGTTLIEPTLAIAGSPGAVRAATEQHRRGVTGAPDLMARAGAIAAGRQLWCVARGSATFPIAGNASNVNRLLHFTEFATLTVQVDGRVTFAASGICRTAPAAVHLEETVRAMQSLASAATARTPDLAAVLDSIQVVRDNLTVRATLSADADAAAKLLEQLVR